MKSRKCGRCGYPTPDHHRQCVVKSFVENDPKRIREREERELVVKAKKLEKRARAKDPRFLTEESGDEY